MPILYTLPTGCASTASGATRSALVAKINCRRRTRMVLPSRTVYAPRPCLRHYIDLYLVREVIDRRVAALFHADRVARVGDDLAVQLHLHARTSGVGDDAVLGALLE